jgi:6-phosphogluconolactonase (cycloisomerase 2 family)
VKVKRFSMRAALIAAVYLGVLSCPNNAPAPSTITQYLLLAACTNITSGFLASFSINETTGALTQVSGSPVPSGTNPAAVAASPNGKFAYVVDVSTGVWAFYMNSITGAPTSVLGTSFSTGESIPDAVAVDPSGRFVFVTNSNGFVTAFTIDQFAGSLALVGSTSAGTNLSSVAVDSTGAFAYLANTSAAPNVPMLSINSSNGLLTLLGTASAGNNPSSVAADPVANFLYAANSTDNTVSGFTINAMTGALTPIGSTTATGTSPDFVTVDPRGRFLYAANAAAGGGTVSAFTINSATGALTGVSGSPFFVGATAIPVSLAIDPTGKYLYAGSNSAPGAIYGFTIDQTTGALSAISGSPFIVSGAMWVPSVAAVAISRPGE